MSSQPGDHVIEAFIDECIRISDEPTYPSGSVFISDDAPWAAKVIRRYLDQGIPVVLVRADGHCDLVDPRQLQKMHLPVGIVEDRHQEAVAPAELASSQQVC